MTKQITRLFSATDDPNDIGYMARALVQATLPHSNPKSSRFTRKNGAFTLSIVSHESAGLPYGSIPRVLMAWISTEAVRTQNKHLLLGANLTAFMTALDLIPTGGRWGSITRLKDQMTRLFSSSISCTYDDGKTWRIRNVYPVEKADLFWDPKNPGQSTLWESSLTLGDAFFQELITHPVPVDLAAIKALKRSPLALDIYCWLTYRMSYLRETAVIPWTTLETQFGSDYVNTRVFKQHFKRQLRNVLLVYPAVNIEDHATHLLLAPSKPHVPISALYLR